ASLGACLFTAVLMWTTVARPEAPVRNDNLIPFLRDVRGPGCDPKNMAAGMITAITPLNTPLFNPRGMPLPAACNPVLAPDGHQVTLGEFQAVMGRVRVKCINEGTHSVLHFSGLQPGGAYTVWLFLVDPMTPPPPYLGAGTLGRTELSENHFIASEAGEGQISRTTPEQNLSAFGHVGPCFLDGPVELHLVYHIDQQTHGPVPGPQQTWVVNARFLFP